MSNPKRAYNLYIGEQHIQMLTRLAEKLRRSPSSQIELLVEQEFEAEFPKGSAETPSPSVDPHAAEKVRSSLDSHRPRQAGRK